MITAERYHDFCAGHRVVGHEGKCRNLHGHNYRVHFECAPLVRMATHNGTLDSVGRVIDFGEIKNRLCEWLEENWDHKMLVWKEDEILPILLKIDPTVVEVHFNPTAENMAKYLVEEIGPEMLCGTGVVLIRCRIEETRKCSCTYTREGQ